MTPRWRAYRSASPACPDGVACRPTMAGRPPRGIADRAGGVAGAHQVRDARADRPTCGGIGTSVRVTAVRSRTARAGLRARVCVHPRRGDRSGM